MAYSLGSYSLTWCLGGYKKEMTGLYDNMKCDDCGTKDNDVQFIRSDSYNTEEDGLVVMCRWLCKDCRL